MRLKLKNTNFTNIKALFSLAVQTVASNQVSFAKKDFKYFICYKNSRKIRSLCKFLPKMSAYRRDFGETKYVSFLIKKIFFEIGLESIEIVLKYTTHFLS